MRRHDREITQRAEIDAIIRDCQVCRLAMAVDDSPYLVPVSFGYDGQALYFHTARTGRKIDCIERNSQVCFEFERRVRLVTHPERACSWTFTYESVIGFGTVEELHQAGERMHAMRQIVRQYAGSAAPDDALQIDEGDLDRTRVWRIAIRSMTGKRAPGSKPTG